MQAVLGSGRVEILDVERYLNRTATAQGTRFVCPVRSSRGNYKRAETLQLAGSVLGACARHHAISEHSCI